MTLQKILNTIAYCKEVKIYEIDYHYLKESLLMHCDREKLESIRLNNTTNYEIVSIGSQNDVLTIEVAKE